MKGYLHKNTEFSGTSFGAFMPAHQYTRNAIQKHHVLERDCESMCLFTFYKQYIFHFYLLPFNRCFDN